MSPETLKDQQPRLSISGLSSRSSDVIFAMKLVLYAALIMMGAHLALSDGLLARIAGTFLLGAMFAHGVELQHQVLHAQGFQNRTWNETIGVLLGLPMLVSYAEYKASHMHHHKYIGTPENREFFNYGDQYGLSSLRCASSMLLRLFMIAHYVNFLKNSLIACTSRPFPHAQNEVSRRIARDYRIMLVLIVAGGLWMVLHGSDALVKVWVLPLVLVATPVHALIEMPEHFRCNTDSIDPFANTRTIKSNAFMQWFTNGNNYHVEHHLMPGLPIDRLHDLHAKIQEKCIYQCLSYRQFYGDLLRSMRKVR